MDVMSHAVARPCSASDLVALTPEYRGSWGPALPRPPIPWSQAGRLLGFDFVATVRSDSDWNTMKLDPAAGMSVRYVLVPIGDDWELRVGRTDSQSARNLESGSHRHMFSVGEQELAEQQGLKILSGYIYGIEDDQITIG